MHHPRCTLNDSLFNCNSVGKESVTGSLRGVGTGFIKEHNFGVKGMIHLELSMRSLGFLGSPGSAVINGILGLTTYHNLHHVMTARIIWSAMSVPL